MDNLARGTGVGFSAGTRGRLTGLTALVAALTMVLSACAPPENEVVYVTVQPGSTAGAGVAPGVTIKPTGAAEPVDVGPAGNSSAPSTESVKPRKVLIKAKPEFGAKKLAPTTRIGVTAFNATIKSLKLVSKKDGAELEGAIGEDGSTWSLTDRMEYGTTYAVKGTSVSTEGVEKPIKGSYTTVEPGETMRAAFQVGEGEVVGVAMPIILTFDGPIEDKAAAEATLKVTTDGKKIAGSWAWLQDEDIDGFGIKRSRVHYRTKNYWPANTQVTVEANLYGVDLGNSWGREDLVKNFEIGRSMIIKADASSFRLMVVQDGQTVKNFPVSYGSLSNPDRVTREGIHIVQEKKETFDMCAREWGYCGVLAKWAVRISNNGEFVHVNEQTERAGQLGKANVSHGCINMGLADGKTFYDMVLRGDPVEVTNTSGPKLSPKDGDIFDWAIPWKDWITYSAL